MAYSDLKESTKCYDDIRVTTENLRRNGEKQLKTIDGRISLIKEFFKSQSYENMELRDIINLYERFSSLQTAINTSPHSHSEISKYFDIVSVPEKVELCKCISECISYDSEIYESLSDIGEHCHDDARGKTAYMKNDFTDSAYELFSKAIDLTNASHHTSFQSVCEDVDLGFCEYCILPVENSSAGKLKSFYSMIDKYELKICFICKVVHDDGENFTNFALLSKYSSFSGILSASNAYLNKRRLEVRITQTSTSDYPLYDVLRAADACSMKPQRIDSFPLSYNEDLLGYYIVFSMNNPDIKTFLTYLTLELPQSYVVGIYSIVN